MILSLSGCGKGGSAGTPAGEGPGNPLTAHPKVSGVEPIDQSTEVSAFSEITMTFDKAMNPATFLSGLEITPTTGIDSFACESADCKTIILHLFRALKFGKTYTLTLKAGDQGIRDVNGLGLEADYIWTFTVGAFAPELLFSTLILDGKGMEEQAVDENGDKVFEADGTPVMIAVDDAGECTAIHFDEADPDQTIHITYLSVTNRSPKHAFCSTMKNGLPNDCAKVENWAKEIIDPSAIAISSPHKLGRDINLEIESIGPNMAGRLHVSYRDFAIETAIPDANNENEVNALHDDDAHIIKYAVKEPGGLTWTPVKVYDATDGVSDTFIKVDSKGRIHIIYHAKNQVYVGLEHRMQHSLMYSTCASNCETNGIWTTIEVDGGWQPGDNLYAQPSFLFVKDNRIHISYYANFKLKYATCTMDLNSIGCNTPAEWETVHVDIPATAGDVGTENSIFVDNQGIHISYRDNVNSQLKYAYCDPSATASACLSTNDWQNITADSNQGRGRSTQIKLDALKQRHVVYGDSRNNHLRYAYCESDCNSSAQWSSYLIEIDAGHDNYISIGNLSGTPTIFLSTRDDFSGALKFAFGLSP